jgi:hypothetical protein
MNNTIITILNILNIMAELIELSVLVSVRVIALAIVLTQYAIEAVQFVYINRKSITEKMNPFSALVPLWELSTFPPSVR